MFDHFWNSECVVSAPNLTSEPDPEHEAQAWSKFLKQNREAGELAAFPAITGIWARR